jgi:hypothetical protein
MAAQDSTPFFHQSILWITSSELAWQRRDSTPSSTRAFWIMTAACMMTAAGIAHLAPEHSVNHNSSELAWQRRG